MCALRANRHILDLIIRELLERSMITGLEMEGKMKDLSPLMFEDFVKPFQKDADEEEPFPHMDRVSYQPIDSRPAPLTEARSLYSSPVTKKIVLKRQIVPDILESECSS